MKPEKEVNMQNQRTPLAVVGTVRETRDRCGHTDLFKILKGEPPASAARRKEKWKAKNCAVCVEAENVRARQEGAARRAAKAVAEKVRFPDGSSIDGKYDALKKMWIVTLTIPSGPVCGVLQVEKQGIHYALWRLGFMYRELLKREALKVVAP